MESAKIHSIGRNVAIYTMIVSALFAIISLTLQLTTDYRRDINDVEASFLQIDRTHVESLIDKLFGSYK